MCIRDRIEGGDRERERGKFKTCSKLLIWRSESHRRLSRLENSTVRLISHPSYSRRDKNTETVFAPVPSSHIKVTPHTRTHTHILMFICSPLAYENEQIVCVVCSRERLKLEIVQFRDKQRGKINKKNWLTVKTNKIKLSVVTGR